MSFAKYVIIPFFILAVSCQSYTQQTKRMRYSLYNGDYASALDHLESSALADTESDRVVYLMEKGSILYLQGKFEEAARSWRGAVDQIEDFYSTSVSKTAGSFVLSDNVTDFEGEAHEQILLPVFSALAYLAADEPDKAIVEIRKTHSVLKMVKEKFEGKIQFNPEFFAHYLAGYVYEVKGELDSAFIAYTKAVKVAEGKGNIENISPKVAASELYRIAKVLRRKRTIRKLRDKYGFKKATVSKRSASVLVIVESGNSPIKRSTTIPVVTGSRIMRISWPEYISYKGYESPPRLLVDGKSLGRLETVQNIDTLARASLEARRLRDAVKIAARMVAKGVLNNLAEKQLGQGAGLAMQALNFATETADTRGWSTLPRSIKAKRIFLTPHKPTLITVRQGGFSQSFEVNLGPGESQVLRMRSF